MAINLYNTDIADLYTGNDDVEAVYLGDELVWPLGGYRIPLTFEIISGGTILWKTESTIAESNHYNVEIEYSLDGGRTWTPTLSKYTDPDVINVEAGDTIMFRGTGPTGKDGYRNSFSGTALFRAYGNAYSLLSHNFSGITSLANYAHQTLAWTFYDCKGIVDASELVLPATILTEGCYFGMFQKATRLTKGPVLPAPALKSNCYHNLFSGCSSLTAITCLATSTGQTSEMQNQLTDWVAGVAPSGVFTKSPNATNWPTGSTRGIPSGWTVIDADT